MTIEIRTGVKCTYKCGTCGIGYTEQRDLQEPQFFTECQKSGCFGVYQLISQTEYTYEQYVEESGSFSEE
jgi:hypothetical protein